MSCKEFTGYCRCFNPSILGIIEPKVAFSRVRPAFWKNLDLVPVHQNVRVAARSNNWIFSKQGINAQVLLSTNQLVLVSFDFQNTSVMMAVVHGHACHIQRRQLWYTLLPYCTGSPLIVMGDFNAVKGAHERRSSMLPRAIACREFVQFMDEANLIDLPTSGIKYTWASRRRYPNHVESRLDRSLCSDAFADLWVSVEVEALPRLSSDHSLLVMR